MRQAGEHNNTRRESMELETSKPRNKRDSPSVGGERKKRKSYSSVAQAWLETLSEAIQDDFPSPPTSPKRRLRPRRNAFVLHMDEDEPEGLEQDDSSPRHLYPESSPPWMPDIEDVAHSSEIEKLELAQ